jgi:diacylglycerol kinase family enzyme
MPSVSERVLIFANPIAGRGKGKAIAQRLSERLRRDRYDAQPIFERADRVPDDHLPDGVRAAIAIGGDGTVRGVTRRLYQRFARRTPPLLNVPMGTANLLGRHLGTLWPDRELAARVADAIGALRTVHLDAATANDELFLLMAGIGLDAKIVHELDRLRSGPIDLTSYALPAALALGFYTYPALTVSVDGRKLCKDLPAVAFVGNVKEYGTGFPILPHARPDDGLLDVCVLPCANRVEALHQFMRAASGEHTVGEGSIYAKGKRVKVDSAEQVPVQIDGEAAGHTPLTCELLPVRLPFIVPAE